MGPVDPKHSITFVIDVPACADDDLLNALGRQRGPEVVVRDMLRDAADSRGLRTLVMPPERHAELP